MVRAAVCEHVSCHASFYPHLELEKKAAFERCIRKYFVSVCLLSVGLFLVVFSHIPLLIRDDSVSGLLFMDTHCSLLSQFVYKKL